MLTPVERVLILKGADLLKDVGPRHLLSLAEAATEIEMVKGDHIYAEEDPADALYMVVEGRVKLAEGEPGGAWSGTAAPETILPASSPPLTAAALGHSGSGPAPPSSPHPSDDSGDAGPAAAGQARRGKP